MVFLGRHKRGFICLYALVSIYGEGLPASENFCQLKVDGRG